MVKIENNLEDNIYRILLRPNQSSDWKSSLIFILIIAFTCLSIGIGFALAGATMILPFAGLEILFVGICVYLVMKNTYKQEVITLTKETLKITQISVFYNVFLKKIIKNHQNIFLQRF